MNFQLTESEPSLEKILKCLSRLRSTRVEVGLPDSAPARSRFLLAIHEHGSPVMHIPPRPVVQPALSNPQVRASMAEALTSACEAASRGDEAGMEEAFSGAGEAGVQGIRSYIDSGISPPNAPVTVSGGWIYNRVAKKGVHVSGKGFNKPLYETGALAESFDYEVKTGG